MDLEWFKNNYNPKCQIVKKHEDQENYVCNSYKKVYNQMPPAIMYFI